MTDYEEIVRLRTALAAATERERALQKLLRAVWAIVPQIDNGTCEVCRLSSGCFGHRFYKGRKPGPCENLTCLSHRVTAALAACPPSAGTEPTS